MQPLIERLPHITDQEELYLPARKLYIEHASSHGVVAVALKEVRLQYEPSSKSGRKVRDLAGHFIIWPHPQPTQQHGPAEEQGTSTR